MSPDSESAPAMPLDPALLEILCCPETKQALTLLDAAALDLLNRNIANGEVQNTGGNLVKEPLDGGLLRSDKQVAYPIREMIPIMLIEEGIPTAGLL
ncbi:MAG: hypothetical protein OXB94_02775 [Nitrospira sp.]|nr:hypothetical protein [Nitrospira sp.]